MRNYRDVLIEELADAEIEETLSYLQVSLREYQKDGYADVLYLAYETAIKAQGGTREFARRTQSNPQDVENAMSNRDETLIANIIAQLPETQCEIFKTETETSNAQKSIGKTTKRPDDEKNEKIPRLLG